MQIAQNLSDLRATLVASFKDRRTTSTGQGEEEEPLPLALVQALITQLALQLVRIQILFPYEYVRIT